MCWFLQTAGAKLEEAENQVVQASQKLHSTLAEHAASQSAADQRSAALEDNLAEVR